MTASADRDRPALFSPARHVLDGCRGRGLSLSARHLAMVLAVKSRQTADGNYVVWRGRKSLADISELSTKTVTKARRELLDAGIFRAVSARTVTARNGKTYRVAKGVRVLELVFNVDTFVLRRTDSRARIAKEVDAETHVERLNIQKRCFAGEFDDAERKRLEDSVRLRARSNRRR